MWKIKEQEGVKIITSLLAPCLLGINWYLVYIVVLFPLGIVTIQLTFLQVIVLTYGLVGLQNYIKSFYK